MKIAFLLTQSLDSPSGLGRYWPLAKEMVRLGHQVTILALHHDFQNLDRAEFVRNGVNVRYVGQMHVHKSGSGKTYFSPAKLLQVTVSATWRLLDAALRVPADVYHLGKPHPMNGIAGLIASWLRRKPLYLDCDDYEAASNRFGGEWQRRIVAFFEDRLPRWTDGVTVNTQFMKRRLQNLGVSQDRIICVPNGVDRARFSISPKPELLRQRWGIPEEDQIIVYVGTLGLKSHPTDLLLKAFERIARRDRSARLMLVGGGQDYGEVKELAGELGIAQRTIFTGRVPSQDVPDYFAAATVSVDPVHDDPVARARSPLKIVESLVAGTPVVTGDVGGRRALLEEGALGRVVSAGDAEALAEGLMALLQDADARAEMTSMAAERREQWYWDRLVRDFVEVYGVDGSR